MMTPILIKLALIVFALVAIVYAVRNSDGISSAIALVIDMPGRMILRVVMLLATLPAAFSMVAAEKELAGVIGKEADAAQIEQIRLKMARSARSAWHNGQVDAVGPNFAYRIARKYA